MGARVYLRRTGLVLAWLLLLSRLTFGAEPAVSADFDGDGRHDHVTLDHADASVLRIWLSSVNSTAVIHNTSPVIHLVARDLDGDRRPELITGGGGGLKVWTRKRLGFRSFKPHHVTPGQLSRPTHRSVDDGPTRSAPAVQAGGSNQPFIALAARPRAPTVPPTPAWFPVVRTVASERPRTLFAPRPPPHSA